MVACVAGLIVQAWIDSNSKFSSMTIHPCMFRPWRALWVLWRVPSSKRLHVIGSTPRRLACHLQCYGLPRHLHGYRCSMYNGRQLAWHRRILRHRLLAVVSASNVPGFQRHLRIVVETSLLRQGKLQLRNASRIW